MIRNELTFERSSGEGEWELKEGAEGGGKKRKE